MCFFLHFFKPNRLKIKTAVDELQGAEVELWNWHRDTGVKHEESVREIGA